MKQRVTHFEQSTGAIIRSRFRSINAHDEQKKELSFRRDLDTLRRSRTHCGAYKPTEKCTPKRRHKCTFNILISSWKCSYSQKHLLFYRLENSAKTTDIPGLRLTKSLNDNQTISCGARNGTKKRSKAERNLLYWSWWPRLQRNSQNKRRKFERPMAPAMHCKRKVQTGTTKVGATQEIASQKIPKTMYGCVVKFHESTGQRVESSLPTNTKIALQAKALRWFITIWFINSFRCPKQWKIPDAKAAVDKEWKKLETIPSMANWIKSRVRRKRKETKINPLSYTDGHLSPQERVVGTQIAKYTKAESYSVVTL